MDENVELSWGNLTRWRQECFQKYGRIHDIPIMGSPYQEIKNLLTEESTILDFGAGVDTPLSKIVEGQVRRYLTLDPDPAAEFDFRSLEEIPEDLKFNIVWSNQVLEHLTISEAFQALRSAYACLVTKGYFIATVPNAAHPVRHWGDATHVTAWPVYDFYGLFRESGYEVVSLYRYNKHRFPFNPIKRLVANIVCEVFRIDWCDSLIIVGQKCE